MATVYDYIAENNPSEAKSLCEAFGYTITNPRQMSRNLKVLVKLGRNHSHQVQT